jgi:hypothetical protein
MYDSKTIRILWMILILFVGFIIWKVNYDKVELFTNLSKSDIIEDVIDIYYKLLQRSPTSQELKTHATAIDEGEYDYRELELRLINSDEYQRLIKTQTNLLVPETKRMVEEKDVITVLKVIYKKFMKKDLKKELYLPMKDLYVFFDFNIYKFIAMIQDSKYPEFESMVLSDRNLSRESLIELYLKTFDDSKLNYHAEALEKIDKGTATNNTIDSIGKNNPGNPISSTDINTNALLAFLLANANNINNPNEAANKLDSKDKVDTKNIQDLALSTGTNGDGGCTASQRVYLPDEAKILRSEYGYNTLQRHPPVCIPVNKPNEVSSVVFSKMMGTPLEEAENTEVGSIMPKFEYRRYIEIPVPGTTEEPEE